MDLNIELKNNPIRLKKRLKKRIKTNIKTENIKTENIKNENIRTENIKNENNEQKTILDIPNEIVRYILREFLKPFAIRNCLLAHRVFWVMSTFDMQLIRQLTTISFADCILMKEPNLCYSMYKYNQIYNVPMLVLRPDFLLIQCFNRLNRLNCFNQCDYLDQNNNDKVSIATFILQRVELKKLKPNMMDNCLKYMFLHISNHISQHTSSYDNAKIFEMTIEKLQNENVNIDASVFPCFFKSIETARNNIENNIRNNIENNIENNIGITILRNKKIL